MMAVDWHQSLDGGLYTVPMAARLLAAKQHSVRAWVEGSPKSDADPILVRSFPRVGGKTLLGFLDVIEGRFVRHFLRLGYSPQTIRMVALRLREKHNTEHPFAMDSRFRADGKKVFQEVIDEDGERKIWNVMNEQFEIGHVIEPSLFDQILYVGDLAAQWTPLPARGNCVVNPKMAFGRPVILPYGVPTETLYAAYLAEGDAYAVADEFGVRVGAVEEAAGFEVDLGERHFH